MKAVNATRSEGLFPVSNPVRSSARPLVAHCASSSRSLGKPSLVTPISTLYASAEKIMSDLF